MMERVGRQQRQSAWAIGLGGFTVDAAAAAAAAAAATTFSAVSAPDDAAASVARAWVSEDDRLCEMDRLLQKLLRIGEARRRERDTTL